MSARKPKPRRGRPPKAVSDARTRTLVVRLHEAELVEMRAAARRYGTPLSTWVRGVAISHARKPDTGHALGKPCVKCSVFTAYVRIVDEAPLCPNCGGRERWPATVPIPGADPS